MKILPVTARGWPDLVTLFERCGPRGGRPMTSGCWCMWWRQRMGDPKLNKQAMETLVHEGREPGLLAYDDDRPVGLGVRRAARGVRTANALPRLRAEGRRRGRLVGRLLLRGLPREEARRRGALAKTAVEHAFRGASAVEAYPGAPPDYMGLRSTFERWASGPFARRASGP